MQPSLKAFREAVNKYRGNLSKVAASFDVTRQTISNWLNAGGAEWQEVVRDARMRLFDDSLISAELLAKGIPIYDQESGQLIGWEEKPDGQMIRYLLSMLGKNEGFSDTPETAADKALDSMPKEIKVQVVYNSADDLNLQPQNSDKKEAEE